MMKNREKERFQAKLAERQRMIDRQCEELARIKNREDEILDKQIGEAEAKAREQFERDQKRKQDMADAIQ
jgi:hypothetical protein